ncbi:hypothetical protein BDQ17DRAFT_1375699 [Cyathus striatus]|nr:hypothetical protein BDQ17DRAFT_1375699 [Cyathus striatus]
MTLTKAGGGVKTDVPTSMREGENTARRADKEGKRRKKCGEDGMTGISESSLGISTLHSSSLWSDPPPSSETYPPSSVETFEPIRQERRQAVIDCVGKRSRGNQNDKTVSVPQQCYQKTTSRHPRPDATQLGTDQREGEVERHRPTMRQRKRQRDRERQGHQKFKAATKSNFHFLLDLRMYRVNTNDQ